MIIIMVIIIFGGSYMMASAENAVHTYQFAVENGIRIIRTDTPKNIGLESPIRPKRPFRNQTILGQVIWVDRDHENAIAENVSIVPNGSGIFAGWSLNNERYSAYAVAGLESPLWTYRQLTEWQMPVSASANNFTGTGANMPAYIWNLDSPLYTGEVRFDRGYQGKGVSFSGDGTLLAAVSSLDNLSAKLTVYDLILEDTVFTRSFVPTEGLYGIDFSNDGSKVLVSNYGGLLVYDVPSGGLAGTLYNYSQNIAKISGDGTRVVTGTFNGTVNLYEWNGLQYDTAWIFNSGHDWVTAVDISTDGSTVACGTINFVGGEIFEGKFILLDADSGSILIEYDEYADEVSSVALSADGQYAIAGCWGQQDGTYGDVVTCFNRDISIPIFQLLDDIDEPGSVFNVAISDSGNYAVAGGKAVHARIWGNGGMLYSIKINDPLNNDVAVASIDDPGEILNPGQTAVPTATFINVGAGNASFTASCTISNIDSGNVVYSSSFDINNLASFATSIVYFSPDFTMPAEGRYRIEMTADMINDEDLSNNNLSLALRSWHDIKIEDVVAPYDEVTYGWPLSSILKCKNLGSYTENFDVNVSIFDSTDIQVFTSQSTIYFLAPNSDEEIQIGTWFPDENGRYRAEFEAVVPGDYFPDNNTASKYFQVVNEMIYDDGVSDINIWVEAYPYAVNRKFGQRFEPNLPAPCIITNVRFFLGNINYTGYFDYLGVTKEVAGFPDTANYLAIVSNPSLSGPGNWTSVDLNVALSDNLPLWVVLHWPDREDLGPYIGADESGIMDEQSYWYADTYGWNQYPWDDWMIRMTLENLTKGNETQLFAGLPRELALMQNYPNPFNPNTSIQLQLPDAGFVQLEIFSVTGAKVRTLVDSYYEAGYYTVVWDGIADSGEKVASGIYYYRLVSGQHRITRKMTMLK